jgi:hypothetical protein
VLKLLELFSWKIAFPCLSNFVWINCFIRYTHSNARSLCRIEIGRTTYWVGPDFFPLSSVYFLSRPFFHVPPRVEILCIRLPRVSVSSSPAFVRPVLLLVGYRAPPHPPPGRHLCKCVRHTAAVVRRHSSSICPHCLRSEYFMAPCLFTRSWSIDLLRAFGCGKLPYCSCSVADSSQDLQRTDLNLALEANSSRIWGFPVRCRVWGQIDISRSTEEQRRDGCGFLFWFVMRAIMREWGRRSTRRARCVHSDQFGVSFFFSLSTFRCLW